MIKFIRYYTEQLEQLNHQNTKSLIHKDQNMSFVQKNFNILTPKVQRKVPSQHFQSNQVMQSHQSRNKSNQLKINKVNKSTQNQSVNETSKHHRSISSTNQSKENIQLMEKLDNQFVKILSEIENYYTHLTKHEQIRVEKWIVKIIQNDETLTWKVNRNNYLKLLHHIVKNYSMLNQPFDKMPSTTKDLPYLSDHDLNQKIKPRFDGKSPAFHIQKPQMIKINQPIGDSCSILMSLVNTARTQMTKQNHHIQTEGNQCKQSKLVDGRFYFNQNDIVKNDKVQNKNNQYQNQEQIQIQKVFFLRNKQLPDISSAIPSNLPSQVKSISHISNRINEVNDKITQRQKSQRHINHQKYSSKPSLIENSNFAYKDSLNSSYVQGVNLPTDQLTVYKQMVLTMGKLLLKHQFTIQKQKEYWQLMRMIYNYQNSYKSSLKANKNKLQNNRAYDSCENRYFSQNKDLQDNKQQSFQQFLSRLREQIGNHYITHQEDNKNDQRQQNMQQETRSKSNLGVFSYLVSGNHSNLTSLKRENSNSERQHQIQHQSRYGVRQKKSTYNKKLYHQNDSINHITEESVDFKIQEGVQPSRVLFFQLKQKARTSQSLMKENDPSKVQKDNNDYYNIYRQLQVEVQPHQDYLNVQRQQYKDQSQEQFKSSDDQLYYKQIQNQQNEAIQQYSSSSQPYAEEEEEHLRISNQIA